MSSDPVVTKPTEKKGRPGNRASSDVVYFYPVGADPFKTSDAILAKLIEENLHVAAYLIGSKHRVTKIILYNLDTGKDIYSQSTKFDVKFDFTDFSGMCLCFLSLESAEINDLSAIAKTRRYFNQFTNKNRASATATSAVGAESKDEPAPVPKVPVAESKVEDSVPAPPPIPNGNPIGDGIGSDTAGKSEADKNPAGNIGKRVTMPPEIVEDYGIDTLREYASNAEAEKAGFSLFFCTATKRLTLNIRVPDLNERIDRFKQFAAHCTRYATNLNTKIIYQSKPPYVDLSLSAVYFHEEAVFIESMGIQSDVIKKTSAAWLLSQLGEDKKWDEIPICKTRIDVFVNGAIDHHLASILRMCGKRFDSVLLRNLLEMQTDAILSPGENFWVNNVEYGSKGKDDDSDSSSEVSEINPRTETAQVEATSTDALTLELSDILLAMDIPTVDSKSSLGLTPSAGAAVKAKGITNALRVSQARDLFTDLTFKPFTGDASSFLSLKVDVDACTHEVIFEKTSGATNDVKVLLSSSGSPYLMKRELYIRGVPTDSATLIKLQTYSGWLPYYLSDVSVIPRSVNYNQLSAGSMQLNGFT